MIIKTLSEGSYAWIIIHCPSAQDLPYKEKDVIVHRECIKGVYITSNKISSKRYKVSIKYHVQYSIGITEVFKTLKEVKTYAKNKKYKIVKIRNKKSVEKLYNSIKNKELL